MHILDKIVVQKRKEIAAAKAQDSLSSIEQNLGSLEPLRSFSAGLKLKGKPGFICEFKRKSPSKFDINLIADVKNVVSSYINNGAAALSVLTDQVFFGAQRDDFINARKIASLPILRKDFIVDSYQIYQSKLMGADCILLIAWILSKQEIIEFTTLAHDLGMEVLLEVHHENELNKYHESVDIVGINNRNLDTFEVDYNHSLKILKLLSDHPCIISESGIHSVEVVKELFEHGFDGFLMGEFFMKSDTPGTLLKTLNQSFEE